MTISELREYLKYFDGDKEVLFAYNSFDFLRKDASAEILKAKKVFKSKVRGNIVLADENIMDIDGTTQMKL